MTERLNLTEFDFLIENHGTICLIRPENDWARDWLYDNLHEPQWLGDAAVVEHRYIGDIVQGLQGLGAVIKTAGAA